METKVAIQEARELRLYLRTVGDLMRLQILRQLARGEMTVMELAQALPASQPLVSWHLGVLRRLELVQARRDGRLAHYTLNRATMDAYRQRFDAWMTDQPPISQDEENKDVRTVK